MMRLIIALIAGGLFGAGLHISGMTDTQKVLGFLDFFGAWDPTLAFVMVGAIAPMALAWRYTQTASPWVGGAFPNRPSPVLGRPLVVGALLFGMGWGLVGLCPGPAVASISYGDVGGWIFLGAMVSGMIAAPPVKARLDSQPTTS